MRRQESADLQCTGDSTDRSNHSSTDRRQPEIIVAGDDAEIIEADPDPEWTYDVEAPEQGGEEFVRCEGCGAEILLRLGGKDAMIHRRGCPRGEGR